MASGGIRYDFTEADGFTHHENRTIRLPILDENGEFVDAGDLTDAEWNFYIFHSLKANQNVLGADAVISKLNADITYNAVGVVPDLGTGPCIDVPLVPSDTAGLKAKEYAYEAYRVDADHQTRIAYGIWPLID